MSQQQQQPVVGLCRLCLTVTTLVDSHVVPRWHWKRIKSGGKYVFVDLGSGQVGTQQSDMSEHLMCAPCDRSFSDVESEMRGLVDQWLQFPEPGESGIQIALSGTASVPYRTVKVFALLTVWRMSISSHPYWANVKLEPAIEEDLRVRLKVQEPGEATDYPLMVKVDCGGRMRRSHTAPAVIDGVEALAGSKIFVWQSSGAMISVLISGHGVGRSTVSLFLQEDGTLPYHPIDLRETGYFDRLVAIKQGQAQIASGAK